MPTGDAPSASITQAPVRLGMRILRPFRSSGECTGLSTVWMPWPWCTCRNRTCTPLYSCLRYLLNIARIARFVADGLLVYTNGSSNTSVRGNRLAV